MYVAIYIYLCVIECLRIVEKERHGSGSTTTHDTTTGTVTINFDAPETTSASAGSDESGATNNSG